MIYSSKNWKDFIYRQSTLSVLDQSVLSWKTENMKLANDCIERIEDFKEIYDSFLIDGGQKKDIHSLYLIREEFKKSILLAQNIAEIVIDLNISL